MNTFASTVPFSASELLSNLRALGVQLWADEGQLRYKANKGVLTEKHLNGLRQAKQEIINLLEVEQPAGIAADPAGRFEAFPLTDVQSAYLLGRQQSFGLGGVACHGYLELTYPTLDVAAFENAWNHLIARHDMLRAVIEPDGYQHVLPEVAAYRVKCVDLRDHPRSELEHHLVETRAQMDHRMYPSNEWPQFELRVTRTAEGDIVHFSLDSLIADWASANILFHELDELMKGKDVQLPALDIGFRECVLAQRRLSDSPSYQKDRKYWADRLDTLPPAPELPLNPAALDNGAARFERMQWRLPADRWAQFCKYAGVHGITPSMAVLTAYTDVLRRWSRHEHFSLNLTLLNRPDLHPQIHQIVGDFTSVTLLEVTPAGDSAFNARASAMGQQLFSDLDHRSYSGIQVIRDLARQRGREVASMPVVFTSAIGLGSREAPSSGRVPGYGVTQTPQVFLDCQVMDNINGLEVNWDIRQGILMPGVVEDMHASFREKLEELSLSPKAWSSKTPLSLPARQLEERDQANATGMPFPDTLLHHDFLWQAHHQPDALAVADHRTSLSYAFLARRAAAVANALQMEGCKEGQLVPIVMEKGVEQVIAVLGVLLAGAAYVPISPTQPRLRRERMLLGTSCEYVLTQSGCAILNELAENAQPILVDTLPQADTIPPLPSGNPRKLAYVIYTSGSTGEPKGVMITHRAALNTIRDINRRGTLTADDRVLGLASLSFDLSVYDIFGALSVGAALIYPDPSRIVDPSHWAGLIKAHDVSVWNSVPAQMQMLVTYLDTEPTSLPSLRLALLSGDWVPVTLPDHARSHMPGLRVIALGGATEAAIWSNFHDVIHVLPEWNSIPYGRPLANQGLRVLTESLLDAPTHVTGDLYITGEGLATGYLGDQILTDSRFLADPHTGQRIYRTGDLARYLPGGEVEFLGREDGQVKVNGHRIEIGEIESVMLSHPDVGATAVVASGEGRFDRKLLAFAEPAVKNVDPLRAPANVAQLLRAATQSTESMCLHMTPDTVEDYLSALREFCQLSILRLFKAHGLFGTQEQRFTADDVVRQAHIALRHHWLARRWLALLSRYGYLRQEASSDTYSLNQLTDDSQHEASWQQVEAGVDAGLWTQEYVSYIGAHAEQLQALLEDRQNPFELLFPEGRADIALSVYRDLLPSRYNNQALAAILKQLVDAQPSNDVPFRIVEVGAGTGATTEAALAQLKGAHIDYLYTDVTSFFIPSARERFSQDGVRFGLLDLDKDYRKQGFLPNNTDVIICAGILNSVQDPSLALQALAQLLAPNGWLLFTEPTSDLPEILLTQGFMMVPATGNRHDGASPLATAQSWRERISASGGEVKIELPETVHPVAPFGMMMMAAQFKTAQAPLRADVLTKYIAQHLPTHMQPSHLQVVDRLPLTSNSKIDRNLLAQWKPASMEGGADSSDNAEIKDPLEATLCSMWAEALGIEHIAPDDNFYDHGADSLILARMAGRLRETVPQAQALTYDALLRQMLNQPTVSALAGVLRADGSSPSSQAIEGLETQDASFMAALGKKDGSNALLVHFGGGQGPMRVMFHAALGTLDYFQHLGKTLARQELGPVIGIAVADPEIYVNIPNERLVEHVADDYAARLEATGQRSFQLVGYCLGGILATEVARRLLDRGLEVLDLSLVDSIPMFIDTDEELAYEAIFAPNLNLDPVKAVFGDEVSSADVYRAIDLLMAQHDNRVPSGALACVDGDPGLKAVAAAARQRGSLTQAQRLAGYAASAAQQRGLPIDPEMVPAFFRVCRHSMKSALVKLSPYLGDMTYLRCQEQQSFGITAGVGHYAEQYWQDICLGQFTLIDVPGNHFSVIEPPLVDISAEHLAQGIRRHATPALQVGAA